MITTFWNSFAVLFHKYDTPNSEQTKRYQIGQIVYFTCFLILFVVQTIVMIDGFVTYCRWRRLVIPSKVGLQISEIDDQLKSTQQQKLEVIRALFAPEIHRMNIIFLYLQVPAVVRFVCYVSIRFRSKQAFIDWVPIGNKYFYVIYFTEMWITFGLFAFLFDERKK